MVNLVRTPEIFEEAKLLGVDCDGTTHITGEAAEGIKTVNDAYAESIDTHMGPKAADLYIVQGHDHRTPPQIVADLAKELKLGFSTEEIEELAQLVANSKKSILVDQVGSPLPSGAIWPQTTDGFKEFWESIYAARAKGRHIDTATISSGHTPFIEKEFGS
jgi:hypothetical protein